MLRRGGGCGEAPEQGAGGQGRRAPELAWGTREFSFVIFPYIRLSLTHEFSFVILLTLRPVFRHVIHLAGHIYPQVRR